MVPRLKYLQKKFPSLTSVLDVGAGFGGFLHVSQKKGFHGFGLEVSEFACQQASEIYGVDVRKGRFLDFDFGNKKFDIIHMSHVFEHFGNPSQVLIKARSLMTDNSVILIEVPNQFNSWVEWLRDLRFTPRPRSVFSVHHPFFYNPGNLRKLMRKNGFRIIKTRNFFPRRYKIGLRPTLWWAIDFIASFFEKGFNIEICAQIASSRKNEKTSKQSTFNTASS